jgi:C4-dicarboxylate-specific signal transduction histidine kinase
LWEQYRWPLIAILAVVLTQAALISGLLFQRRRLHFAELESRRRLLEVAHLNRTATAGAMSASIAHELNQPLGAILVNTEAVEMLLKADQLDRKQIEEILVEIRLDDQRAGKIIKGLAGLLKRGGDVGGQELDLRSHSELGGLEHRRSWFRSLTTDRVFPRTS